MNPTKTALWGILIGLLCPFFSWTQSRHYHTQTYMEELTVADPQLAANRLALEIATQQYVPNPNSQHFTIPIVFHVLYSNEAEQLSLEQTQAQLDVLNSDFAMAEPITNMSSDPYNRYLNRAVSTDIQFCYPSTDPLGSPTSGVNYVAVADNLLDDLTQIKTAATGAAAWDADRYLNVWVCALPDSISGYAQMPGGAVSTDGIVIDYRLLGTGTNVQAPYHLGHTLTHLVGNYLNLYPLWGFEKCGTDHVRDTPHHNAPNHASLSFDPNAACVSYEHVSTCTGYPLEMTMNFMDNSGDACMYMFTKGQRQRMHAALNVVGGRTQLALQATNCTPTLQNDETTISIKTEDNAEIHSRPAEVLIFPNPASGKINVRVSDVFIHASTQFEIYHSNGQRIYASPKGVFEQPTFQLDIANWTTGLYFLQVKNEHSLLTRKFSVK